MERIAFSIADVAAATGQSVSTVKNHVRAGRLRVVRPAGGDHGRLYVRAEDLDAYLSPVVATGGGEADGEGRG